MGDSPERRDWPLLAVAAVTLLAGAVRGRQDGLSDPLVASLMTAGLIALGAWIAVEVRRR